MTKDREERKREKKERKEKKLREAEELAVKEKKISKKHKSKSKETEKPKKKSKRHVVEEEEQSPKKSKESKKKHKRLISSDDSEEEEQPPKKSKESKKKHKRLISSDEEEPETHQIVDTKSVKVAVVTTKKESDSDFELDKEDIKQLLESYSKEELINLIYKTAEKGSKLISAVFESADRDSNQRNIFVRGLGWDSTHENVKAAFEVYGEVEECNVVMDKDTERAKGFGFVLFKTRKGAREALRNPEKRMYNRTVVCSIAKPYNAAKTREPVESVKIDLTHTANQSEVALPGGIDLAPGHVHGLDKGHQQQQQNMAMYAGYNMPFYGHAQPPPGFNPMYGAMMANQGAMMSNQMVPGLPNYHMFGSGMMNQGPMVPPNHMGMPGQYVGDGNVNGVGVGAGLGYDEPGTYGATKPPGQYVGDGNVNGVGVGAGFDGKGAWYLR
ncbi:PREDICTED: UBP1-associated proteins 1B-like [Camelina sativa]|uniref:UBP1-associated proteins 1B-like n=1 Tax=Camelina sativa TaxID=90675 RepID=A0ABM1QFZ5_CAMSA|nr:PREDICTED: UBP1-associated proteins 1B-like [Camelina sativa]